MSKVDPEYLIAVSKAVLAALLRTGRLPVRLDEEDMNDLESEGVIAALLVIDKYNPERGSLRAYLDKPVSRAIIREAWRIANIGITGDHESLQVFSADVGTIDEDDSESLFDSLVSDDVAAEIEAFDHVWKTRYLHD